MIIKESRPTKVVHGQSLRTIGDSELVMRLNGIDERLERQQYPATTSEIIAAHGNESVDLAEGSERLGDILTRMGEETFERPDDVFTAIRSGVCARGVGRRFYSDRDPDTPGEQGPEPVSF